MGAAPRGDGGGGSPSSGWPVVDPDIACRGGVSAGAPKPAAGSGGVRSLITVVIVDDSQMLAASVAAVLNRTGDCSVLAVAGLCALGIAAVARYRPDVLLLDQRLPDGLGTDHLAAMLAGHPSMRVLVMTGDGSADAMRRSAEAGAAGVVPKGLRAAALVAAVRGVVVDNLTGA